MFTTSAIKNTRFLHKFCRRFSISNVNFVRGGGVGPSAPKTQLNLKRESENQTNVKNVQENKETNVKTDYNLNATPLKLAVSEQVSKSYDFAAENEKRIAEILEYYSQYEKEISQGGYEDDVEFDKFVQPDEEDGQKYPVELTRGETGVFELHEVVTLLQSEKAIDICCIEMPKDLCYADYVVVCTPFSVRHSNAIAQVFHTVYKKKRNEEEDPPFVKPEKNQDWVALDLGTIVVHIMTEEMRKKYDIEMLWTVGPEFDDNTLEKSEMEKLTEQYKSILTDAEWLEQVTVKK